MQNRARLQLMQVFPLIEINILDEAVPSYDYLHDFESGSGFGLLCARKRLCGANDVLHLC